MTSMDWQDRVAGENTGFYLRIIRIMFTNTSELPLVAGGYLFSRKSPQVLFFTAEKYQAGDRITTRAENIPVVKRILSRSKIHRLPEPWHIKLVFLAATANCISPPSYSTSAAVATSTAASDNKHSPVVASSYTTCYSQCFTCGILSSLPYYRAGLLSLFFE